MNNLPAVSGRNAWLRCSLHVAQVFHRSGADALFPAGEEDANSQ